MSGKNFRDSALQAGFSPTTALKGKALVTPAILRRFRAKGFALMSLSDEMSPDAQEKFVRGGLVENVLRGKDAAVQSLKLLGQDNRVNMFKPDSMTGVIVLQAPNSMISGSLPELEEETA